MKRRLPLSDQPPIPPLSRIPKKPIGVLRGIAAAIGIIVMLLSGGCAVIFAGSGVDPNIVSSYAGPPFLIGLAIWWLAVKVGR